MAFDDIVSYFQSWAHALNFFSTLSSSRRQNSGDIDELAATAKNKKGRMHAVLHYKTKDLEIIVFYFA